MGIHHIFHGLNNIQTIFTQRIIYRICRGDVLTRIVNPKTAAKIEVSQWCALALQFNKKPSRFLCGVTDFNNVRYLTAQMRVLQDQPIKRVMLAKFFNNIHDLWNT